MVSRTSGGLLSSDRRIKGLGKNSAQNIKLMKGKGTFDIPQLGVPHSPKTQATMFQVYDSSQRQLNLQGSDLDMVDPVKERLLMKYHPTEIFEEEET